MRYTCMTFLLGCSFMLHAQNKVPVTIAGTDSLREVTDPQISPDGQWVSYTVTSVNEEKDYATSDIWMTRWDGSATLQLTFTGEQDEWHARFSPDGKYIGFLSSRKSKEDDDDVAQLWLLNRAGGEAEQVTSFAGGVDDFAWSPDGSRVALIATVKDTMQFIQGTQTPLPIVINRYYFKEDYSGYLGTERKHLFVMDVATQDTTCIVDGNYEERLPAWSPDGKRIAFVSKRARPDWDRDNNWDVYVVDAQPHAVPLQITHAAAADCEPDFDSPPSWSPDGKWIAYFQGGDPKLIYYGTHHLAIAPSDGGAAKLLTANYDRNVSNQRFSSDGKAIYFVAEDDQNLELEKIPAGGGEIQHLLNARYTIYGFDEVNGKVAMQYTDPNQPSEIFVLDENVKRQLTHFNDDWLNKHALATTREFHSKSKDGTLISGFYVLPHDYVEGKKYPTILQIHGGPISQNQNEWATDWQLYAAWGYVTVSMNPRGSTTKGEKFATALFAHWGDIDLLDDLSGVDELIRMGIADPDKLGVEGWSYGGIATDNMIAKYQRFKCAVCGAGTGNALAGLGTDMYIREYIEELGTPWHDFQNYVNNSYPFLHADKIKTPTLFMCGNKDFNVPLLNSEQMYQALQCNEVPAELIIYPDQFHELSIPSYLRDRYERRKAWFDKYLK